MTRRCRDEAVCAGRLGVMVSCFDVTPRTLWRYKEHCDSEDKESGVEASDQFQDEKTRHGPYGL